MIQSSFPLWDTLHTWWSEPKSDLVPVAHVFSWSFCKTCWDSQTLQATGGICYCCLFSPTFSTLIITQYCILGTELQSHLYFSATVNPLHCIPPTDRQTDRASKPGDWGLSPGFCEPLPRWLGRLATSGRVCLQQSHPLSYSPHPIQAGLRPAPMDGLGAYPELHCRSCRQLCPANVSNTGWGESHPQACCGRDGMVLWLLEKPCTCLWSQS